MGCLSERDAAPPTELLFLKPAKRMKESVEVPSGYNTIQC